MSYSFDTLAIHAGQDPEGLTGAVTVPIFQTSTYAQEAVGKPRQGYEYSRTANPTRKAYEECAAALEGGKYGLAYASGLAATSNLMYLLKSGDEVLVGDDVYGGTYRYFSKVINKFGIKSTFVDTSSLEEVRQAMTPQTRMVWLETPTNPLLKISDIQAVAELSRSNGCTLVVDNTFASPYLQRPLELGADVVLHSATKYIGGHSDLVGGLAMLNRDDLYETLHFHQNAAGAIPGPFDCWLALRGLKTLALRMEAHCRNARKLAQMLEQHEQVNKVIYPGLSSHPQHDLAQRQMRHFGGMISFEIKGGLEEAKRLVESTKLFLLAESLGGVESLIELPALMTHASIPAERRRAMGIADGLIRLSVGIEGYDDLSQDLQQALSAAFDTASTAALAHH